MHPTPDGTLQQAYLTAGIVYGPELLDSATTDIGVT
tara:strand:+ start:880 stop:987 length:108 start_codon:yes stop_codon:yes gene_type:complete